MAGLLFLTQRMLRKVAKGEESEVDWKIIQEMLHYLGDNGAQFSGTPATFEFTGFFIKGED